MYHLITFLSFICCRLSLTAALRAGKWLGLFWFHILRIRRGEVLKNLKRAFPEKSPKEIKEIARGTFINMGQYLIEDLRLPLLNSENAPKLVVRQQVEHYYEALKEGRGVIILCAHITSWDLMSMSQAHMGVPLTVPVRLVKNKGIQRFIEQIRRNSGMVMAEPRGSFSKLKEALKRGETVGIIIDQHISPRRGMIVEFFGRYASTTAGLAALARDTGAPIIPVHMVRQPNGTHKLYVEKALHYEEPFAADLDNLRYNTQKYTAIVEGWIRENPAAWLWLHRRWKAEKNPAFAKEIAAFERYKMTVKAALIDLLCQFLSKNSKNC